MKLWQFFDRIVCISLARRQDRWAECLKEMDANAIPYDKVERFEAYDHPTSGHQGCTRSHRMLLRQIAQGPHGRVLILEDDFAAVTRVRLMLAGFKPEQEVWRTHCRIYEGQGNLNERFEAMIPFLPEKWDVLYLGAGYAEAPISRFNSCVVRCASMKGTGSVAVSREFAIKFTMRADEETDGDLERWLGPIDDYYSKFSRDGFHYCLQPRLIYQRQSPSDIDGGNNSRLFDHTDAYHEGMV